MGKIIKPLALLLVTLFLLLMAAIQQTFVTGQQSNQAPNVELQKEFGDDRTASVSNLIQTSDGGYAFVDTGWGHSIGFQPATVYKLDSSIRVQWTKILDGFVGSIIIETNDGGYEISGVFLIGRYAEGGVPNMPVGYLSSIIKIDSQGGIEWIENYTSSPPILSVVTSSIQTSDGGFAYITNGSIIKSDSSNNTQWTKELPLYFTRYIYPPDLLSLIETSDGSIAVLGVDNLDYNDIYTGNIYFAKTDPFLPAPSPTQLPTSMLIPTPTSASIPTPIPTVPEFPILVILPLFFFMLTIAVVLRHRKTNIPPS
jgi:hypothetical protein